MGKGANKTLLNNAGIGQGASGALRKQAGGVYGTVDPILTQEATDPQGYSPTDLTAMNTASQQSLGGATAGVTGEANQESARTRNAGGFQGAIRSGSQDAMKDQSQNAVQIQAQNAQLKQQQQQQALSSLQQLYGTDQATALGYLNGSSSAAGDVKPAGLSALFPDLIKAGGQAAAAYEGNPNH